MLKTRLSSAVEERLIRRIALSEETMERLKQEHDKHPGNSYLFPSPPTPMLRTRYKNRQRQRWETC